jgi:hypothetical protein
MSEYVTVFNFTFEVERIGEETFVIERQAGTPGYKRYGPMPRDMTGPFIDELKEAITDNLSRATEPKSP